MRIAPLRKKYEAFSSDQTIGGSEALFELARDCSALLPGVAGAKLVAVYVLASVFGDIARDQDERPVTSREAAEIFVRLDGPVKHVMAALEAGNLDDLMHATSELVRKQNSA